MNPTVSNSGMVDAVIAPLTWEERFEQFNQIFRAKRAKLRREAEQRLVAARPIVRIDENGRDRS